MRRRMLMNENLFAVLRDNFPEPARCFIETGGGDVFTYGDMLMRSAQHANALVGLGVKPGDRVAVQVGKSIESLMLYLGALRAGAAFLPLNTAYTPAELSYFLGDSEPALVVCRPAMESDIAAVSGEAILETLGDGGVGGTLGALADMASDSFDDAVCSSGDLAAILYTSGTTGRAKGAMLSHGNLTSNAKAAQMRSRPICAI